MRQREVLVLLDRLAEERQRRGIAVAPARRHADAVGLQRLERRRRRILDRGVVLADRGERFAELPAQLLHRRAERVQHGVLGLRLHLRLLDRVAGAAVRRVERDHVALSELRDRPADHRLARGPLTDVPRDIARQPLVGPAAHQPQRPLHALLRHDAQIRRLPQLDVERLLERVVEHGLAGRVHEIRNHDGIAFGERARAPGVDEQADADRGSENRGGRDPGPRHAAPNRRRCARRRRRGSRRQRCSAALEPLQIRAQIGGGLIAQLAILLERLGDDAIELRGQQRRERRRRRRHTREQRLEHSDRRRARERQPARRHLVADDAAGEEIGAAIDVAASRLLRRHIRHGAERDPDRRRVLAGCARRVGLAFGAARGERELRDAEVEHLRLPAARDEDVRRLDVAVHDALGVRGIERVGDLDRDVERAIEGQRPARDLFLERAAVEQLHHHVLLAVVLADVVQRADVRMVQRRGDARLATEPVERLAARGQLRRQELQRDVPPEPHVFGAVDDAHPSAAKAVDDPVRADERADHANDCRGLGLGAIKITSARMDR